MAEIVLRIKANEGGDIITSFSADQIVNNVSTPIGNNTSENNGVNGKSWAVGLPLSDGFLGTQDSKLQSEVNKYNGFMFGATDVSGNYAVTITINGSNIDKIKVVGDKSANQFPVTAILDEGTANEKTIYSDDPSWVILFDNASSSHTIKLTKWNRANYNACFTTLGVFVENLDLGKTWISAVDSLNQSIIDPKTINPGIIASSASFDLVDLNGELKDYIEDGILQSKDIPISLYINGRLVRSHISDDSSYNETSKKLIIKASDTLSRLEGNFPGMLLARSQFPTLTARDVLVFILQQAGLLPLTNWHIKFVNMTLGRMSYYIGSTLYIDTNIYNYLGRIAFKYPYLEPSTYREAINKICQLALINCAVRADGTLRFYSIMPVVGSAEISDALVVPKHLIVRNRDLEKDIFLPNKISGAKITEYQTQLMYKNIYNGETISIDETIAPTATSDIYVVSTAHKTYIPLERPYPADGYNLNVKFSIKIDEISEKTYFDGNLNNIYRIKASLQKIDALTGSGDETRTTLEKYITPTVTRNGDQLDFEFDIRVSAYMESGGFTIPLFVSSSLDFSVEALSVDVSEKEYSNSDSENLLELQSNELIQNNTLFYETAGDWLSNSHPISEILTDTIKYNYYNGVRTGNITLFCHDMYNINGTKKKNYETGEIININDIIRIDGDLNQDGSQRFWKVVGVSINYQAYPTVALTLQEIVKIN